MKSFALVSVLLLAFAAVEINRRFYSTEEYHVRLGKIADQVNSMKTTWTAQAPGRFSKITLEQAKAMMGTRLDDDLSKLPTANYDGVTAPDTFDARTAWPGCQSVSEVRDQANCGSCWAFGAVEAMTDRKCVASGQKDQTRISAEDLLDCCYSCGYGCNGGYPSAAWSYFQHTGLVSGGLYGDKTYCKAYSLAPCAHHVPPGKYPACPAVVPTPACSKTCDAASGRTYSSDLIKGKSTYSVTGENNMKNELSTKGPIEVALTVYEDFLTYKTGVYSHTSGSALGGHAVKALGYGVENNVKYWIIANSWNELWGDNGYIKIKRGNNECGIEGQGVAGDV